MRLSNQLTVLSFGAGQDSTDIFYRIIMYPDFRRKYVKGRLIVIFSDTGDEHTETYKHLIFIQRLCELHDIEFYHLKPEMGYHPNSWPDLTSWMIANDGIMSKAFPKSCTDNLKIKPIYNFLEEYVALYYYQQKIDPKKTGKAFLKRFAEDHGKITVIIGIAKGEETRISNKPSKKDLKALQIDAFDEKLKPKRKIPRWMELAIERIYPLVTEGLDRQACQDHIRFTGMPLPPPSNCQKCPYMDHVELLWMYRFIPWEYYLWVDLERNKVAKWEGLGLEKEKNLGVNGEKMLDQILSEAIEKYGHWTDEQLQDYKMSHGHCVKSKY